MSIAKTQICKSRKKSYNHKSTITLQVILFVSPLRTCRNKYITFNLNDFFLNTSRSVFSIMHHIRGIALNQKQIQYNNV